MKCEIIRDLLPSYLDGLTSEASNQEILAHMEGCEACREILQEMQAEESNGIEEGEKKKIHPFRELNQRMKMTILAVVMACVALGGAFWKVFVRGWSIDPKDVEMNVAWEEGEVLLQFELLNGHVLDAWGMMDQMEMQIGLKQMLQLPGDDRGKYPGRFDYGISLEWMREDGEIEDIAEYPIVIDYGKEKMTYTLGELLEIAKK